MLEITIKSNDARNLGEIATALDRGMADVLTAVGTELSGYISEDFETKSRGNVGASGIQWDALKPATLKRKAKRAKGGNLTSQIGVDKGLMRSTIQPVFSDPDGQGGSVFEVDGNQVTVGFGRSYAKYFDEKRPLIPDEIPQEWEQAAEEILQDWIEDLWNQRQ